jgi:hypothetical protein
VSGTGLWLQGDTVASVGTAFTHEKSPVFLEILLVSGFVSVDFRDTRSLWSLWHTETVVPDPFVFSNTVPDDVGIYDVGVSGVGFSDAGSLENFIIPFSINLGDKRNCLFKFLKHSI